MPRAVKQHLVQRPDGRYRCKYKGKDFYGQTEEEAFAARDAFIAKSGKGSLSHSTVSEFAIPWLKRTYPSVADSTYEGLAIHLQHLVDEIGNKEISKVLPSDIKNVYSVAYKGLSNTYILSAKQLYCSLFDSAMADGLIKFNPARDKAAKPHRGSKPKERILTPQQREWVNTLCKDHRAFPAVMAMLWAGLRPQECKALDIDRDVDFKKNVITVRETAHLDGLGYEFTEEMKTDWSSRKVPLLDPLKEVLKDRHGLLVTTAKGEQINISSWKTMWKSYLFCMETAINGCEKRWYGRKKEHEGKKLPPWIEFDIVPYTLRHAYAAFLRDSGVELNVARKLMGHADTQMILKVYDSVSDDREEAEIRKLRVKTGVKVKK